MKVVADWGVFVTLLGEQLHVFYLYDSQSSTFYSCLYIEDLLIYYLKDYPAPPMKIILVSFTAAIKICSISCFPWELFVSMKSSRTVETSTKDWQSAASCHVSNTLLDFSQRNIFLLTVHHLYRRGKKKSSVVKVTQTNNLSSIISFFLHDWSQLPELSRLLLTFSIFWSTSQGFTTELYR